MDLLINMTPLLVMLLFALAGLFFFLRANAKRRESEPEEEPVSKKTLPLREKRLINFEGQEEEEEEYTTRNPTLDQTGGLPPAKIRDNGSAGAPPEKNLTLPEIEAENKLLHQRLQDFNQMRESLKKVLLTPEAPSEAPARSRIILPVNPQKPR